MPKVKLLSNGNYHVMMTAAGAGWSRWKGIAVTRWQEDATLDDRGSFCYLRDEADGSLWSTTEHRAHVEYQSLLRDLVLESEYLGRRS